MAALTMINNPVTGSVYYFVLPNESMSLKVIQIEKMQIEKIGVRYFILAIALAFSGGMGSVHGQGYTFGFKTGPTLGFQQWNDFQRDPLLGFHGALFMESLAEDDAYCLYTQLGYHQRGAALRYRFNNGGLISPLVSSKFLFHNISLTLGARQKFSYTEKIKYFYSLGIRGEYTVATNLHEYEEINQLNRSLFFPDDSFVNPITAGLTITAGFQYHFAELSSIIVELSVMPDVTRQYFQPPIPNVRDPFNPGQSRDLAAREIRNVSIELSVGLRFLNKYIYID